MNRTITFIIIGIMMISTDLIARSNNPETSVKQKNHSFSRLGNLQDINRQNALDRNTSNKRTAAGATSLLDSVYGWGYDTLTMKWDTVPEGRFKSFVYDANNNLLSYILQTWDTIHFVNQAEEVYTYDANNNDTTFSYLTWNGSAFMNSSKNTYTYDGANNRLTDLYQQWTDTGYVTYSEDLYSYNNNNEEVLDIFKLWNDSVFVNIEEDTLIYNNNNLAVDLNLFWNDSVFVNSAEDIYSYDVHNNQVADTGKTWNDSAFYLYSLITNGFDANNNEISSLYKIWNDSVFINIYQSSATYNVNNLQLSYAFEGYDLTGSYIDGGDSTYNYYQGVAGINELSAENGSISIYPDPVKNMIVLNNQTGGGFNFANSNTNVVAIYDMIGEKVYESTINNQDPVIDVSTISSGVYFIQIINENNRWVGKFVKE